MLEVQNLRVSFRVASKRSVVVDGINFQVDKGASLGIVGESGSGKSVSGRAILGLLNGTTANVEGKALFHGKNLLSLSAEELRGLRGREIGMIFQEPMSALNPVLTVFSQVAETLETHFPALSKKEIEKRVFETLERVDLKFGAEAYRLYPHELSGGMRQRVMIAMSIIAGPQLLIADEPTTALDVSVQSQILNLLKYLQKDLQMALILISHDLGVIAEMTDSISVMYAGKVVEQGRTKEVLKQRLHPYTQGLFDSIPLLHTKKDRLLSMPGSLPAPDALPPGCHFSDRCSKKVKRCEEGEPLLEKKQSGSFARCFEVS